MTTDTEKPVPARKRSPHDWQTSQEAADIIGVHINHLRTIPATELPYYLVGERTRRYKPQDIDAYIESRRVSA